MIPQSTSEKIWESDFNKNYKILTTHNLPMVSEFDKTYDDSKSDDKFRSMISFVTEKFIRLIKLPIFSREVLLYFNVCKVFEKNS